MVHQIKRKINPIVKFINKNNGKFKINVNGQIITTQNGATITYSNDCLYIIDPQNNSESIIKLESIDSVMSIE